MKAIWLHISDSGVPGICENYLPKAAKPPGEDLWAPDPAEGEGHVWDQRGGLAAGHLHPDPSGDRQEEQRQPERHCELGLSHNLLFVFRSPVCCNISLLLSGVCVCGGGDDNFVIVWGHCCLGFKTFNGGFCTSFQWRIWGISVGGGLWWQFCNSLGAFQFGI